MPVLNREWITGLSEAIDFKLKQRLKEVYTSMPGIIEEYDPVTRRAKVRGAIPITLSNKTTMSRSPIVNVPVLFPSGSGYTNNYPLKAGDAVLLVYAMRNISRFKRKYEEDDPVLGSVLSERNAIAIPGFGTTGTVPVSETGFSIQNEDGSMYILLEREDGGVEEKIEIKAKRVRVGNDNTHVWVNVENNEVVLKADNIRVDGDLSVDGNLSVTGTYPTT